MKSQRPQFPYINAASVRLELLMSSESYGRHMSAAGPCASRGPAPRRGRRGCLGQSCAGAVGKAFSPRISHLSHPFLMVSLFFLRPEWETHSRKQRTPVALSGTKATAWGTSAPHQVLQPGELISPFGRKCQVFIEIVYVLEKALYGKEKEHKYIIHLLIPGLRPLMFIPWG